LDTLVMVNLVPTSTNVLIQHLYQLIQLVKILKAASSSLVTLASKWPMISVSTSTNATMPPHVLQILPVSTPLAVSDVIVTLDLQRTKTPWNAMMSMNVSKVQMTVM